MATKRAKIIKEPMPITKRRRKGATGPKVWDNMYRYENEPNVLAVKVRKHKKKVTRVRHKFKDGKGSGKD